MFHAYCKDYLILFLSTLLFNVMPISLLANECDDFCCKRNRCYIGAFGGIMYSDALNIDQMGVAFYPEAVGGPLTVEALGQINKFSAGFGGIQIGYEWSKCLDACSCWTIAPGVEVEGYWLSQNIQGHLINSTDTDRLPEHDFLDSFAMNKGVYLANILFSLNNTWRLSPYLGGGVGATRIALNNADSLQIAPLEAGINHFNSRTNDSAWTFAGQVKAGLRYNICRFHIFGEYRYLFVDASKYIFGSTAYPNHPHTTPWNVKFQNIQYNAFVFGLQYDL